MSSRITPPTADTGSGPGRRWTLVLAVVALVAVVGCLIFLLVTRGDNDTGATPPPVSEPTTAPSTPDEPSTTASTPPASNRCSLPAGNQAIPNTPIHDAQWSLVNRMAVPEAPALGPQRTDPDGLRRCFAHSPTGAVYAAYNHFATMSPRDDPTGAKAFAALRRIMTPGPNRDRYFDYLKTLVGTDSNNSVQLAGFKVLDATTNRATILLAGQSSQSGGYASSTWTLVWQGEDWKVLAPKPGERAGEPYSSLPDLNGFVPWRGA
jgi:hypothetical protein